MRSEGKTFNPEDCSSYIEFLAFNMTKAKNMDNLRDSDDCSVLIKKYNESNPPDGWFRKHWENGKLRYEWYYKDGKQDGVSKSWWPDGTFKTVRNFKNGVFHGELKGWYENGSPLAFSSGIVKDRQLSGIRYWENGKRHDVWTDFYPSGQKWCEKIYDHNELISEKYWKLDGSRGSSSCHKKGELKYFRKINKSFQYV
jgi:antitoxin component YwqK of YwqJK toxin-antitoxin module